MNPFLLADELLNMSADSMPRELPGRYGRAIRDLERLLIAADAMAVVAGGWAVWRHGYAGRAKDVADLVELIKTHRNALQPILAHLATIHPTYPEKFTALIHQADEE